MTKLSAKMALDDMSSKKLLDLARVLEGAEAYEDMCEVMTALVKKEADNNGGFEAEERNQLSVAFKNVVGARRASLRSIANEDESLHDLIVLYKEQLTKELKQYCEDILDLLQSYLIKEDDESEAQVFYLKMAADYYRYLAEGIEDDPKYASEANTYYNRALSIAESVMTPTHPVRLGLVLNYSVCQYEISKNKDHACKLAKNAFDLAISELDSLDEDSYKDSTLIMQLLRDNLTLWTSHADQDADVI